MNCQFVSHPLRLLPLALALLSIPCSHAQAQKTLPETMSLLAENVNKHLSGTNSSSIRIGDFQDKVREKDGTYSSRLRVELHKQLEAQGVRIDQEANHVIEGEFTLNRKTGGISIYSRILDKNGLNQQVISTLGNDPQPDETEQIVRSEPTTNPTQIGEIVELQTETILDPGETLFQSDNTTILDRSKPVTPESVLTHLNLDGVDDGFLLHNDFLLQKELGLGVRLQEIVVPNIQGQPDAQLRAIVPPVSLQSPQFRLHEAKCYIVLFRNYRMDVDLAIRLLFDGVDSTALSESPSIRQNRLWIIPRGKEVAVYGWYINDNETDAFRIVPDPESIAFLYRETAHLGSIQVQAYAAWDRTIAHAIPPEFKVPSARGVAQGPRFHVHIPKANHDIGKLLGHIMVKYETEPNLPERLVPNIPLVLSK